MNTQKKKNTCTESITVTNYKGEKRKLLSLGEVIVKLADHHFTNGLRQSKTALKGQVSSGQSLILK